MKLNRGLNRIRAIMAFFSIAIYKHAIFFLRVVQFYIRYHMLRYKSFNDYLLHRITKENYLHFLATLHFL